MCIGRKTDATAQETMIGLKGGSSCTHRNKKSLFGSKKVRKQIKDNKHKKGCEECERLKAKQEPTLSTEENDILMCATCAAVVCQAHAKIHCEAVRTGDPHPFIYTLNNGTLKCHPCDTILEPMDDPNDQVKGFVSELKSFSKTKSESARKPVSSENILPGGAAVDIPDKPSVKQPPSVIKSISVESSDTYIPAKGLSNLGNTCFYNSVMQCIMHTHHWLFYYERFGKVKSLTFERRTVMINEEKVELDEANIRIDPADAPLNQGLKGFLSEFRSGTNPSPGTVFHKIAQKAPRFKGWQQQDAHELLRYLLDGLRSEETEWYKAGIAAHLGVSPNVNPKKADPIVVKAAKGFLQAAGRPLLDTIFGGTLLQTICCTECNHVSERNEQFLDLSLPLSSNPMSTRAYAGHSAATMSAHQKKKAKKIRRQDIRMNKKSNGVIIKESQEIDERLQEMYVTDESEGEDDFGQKTADPLDYTKVLVSPPVEYSNERSLGSCLLEFTAEERLTGPNAYECEKCCSPANKKAGLKGSSKKRVEAIKRYLIYEPPVVLTLHLKRFHQVANMTGRLTTKKLGGHVPFPLIFDIAPFCCKNVERLNPGQKKILYSLYGVVVHAGDLSGGHYIAYVKSRHRVPNAKTFLELSRSSSVDRMATSPLSNLSFPETPIVPDGRWYYCSDSKVNAVNESRVLEAEAYILFYERIF